MEEFNGVICVLSVNVGHRFVATTGYRLVYPSNMIMAQGQADVSSFEEAEREATFVSVILNLLPQILHSGKFSVIR